MWQIVQIALAGGGRMGEQDVAATDHPHFTRQLAHALGHLALGVHVGAISIAHGAAKPRNADAAIHVHGVFDTDTATWCMTRIAVIVIASHVDERSVDDRDQKLKIVRVQITSGQNQVDTLKAFFAKALPKASFFGIGYGKDFHRARTFGSSSGCGMVPTTLSASQSISTICVLGSGGKPSICTTPSWLWSSPPNGLMEPSTMPLRSS